MKETAIYGRLQPISDVVGRIDYISNHDRQECLLAIGGQVNLDFWRLLAADSQQAWRESGGNRKENKACEAREIQLLLPKKVLAMSKSEQEEMLRSLEQMLREKYGLTCALGLHLSKTDNNVHVHILFAERLKLVEPEVKYASRNVFLDEQGIKRRTQKEIVDENGEVRSGCKVVKKGEVLSVRYFGEKETLFADRDWCCLLKQDMADWINDTLEPDKKRVVFDPDGPYLAQTHIGKGKESKSRKRKIEYNNEVKAFNAIVEAGIISTEEAQHAKSWIMLSPDWLSALGGALAGILLDHPESRVFVVDTKLKNANEESLKYVQKIATGGNRTKDTSDRLQKDILRRLYREAESLRQLAREQESELERTRLMAEARQRSMRIDLLRREMGLYTDQDYRKKLKNIEEELARRNRWVMVLRSRVDILFRRIEWKKRELRDAKAELYSLPLFFKSKEDEKTEQRLKLKISDIEQEIESLKEEEKIACSRYAYARIQEKQEKKRLKEERKQLKAERKRKKKNIEPKER